MPRVAFDEIDDVDVGSFVTGSPEDGLFGVEHCPASVTPAPHVPIFTSDNEWHCVRCRQAFFA